MSQSLRSVLLLLALLTSPALTSAQSIKALVTPISKDDTTSLFSITLNQNQKFVIDLSLPFSWRRCIKAFPNVSCLATQCSVAQSYKPPHFCHENGGRNKNQCSTCTTIPTNPISKSCSSSHLTFSNVNIASTNGHNPLAHVNFHKIYMSCAPDSLFKSLPQNASRMASLSPSSLSYPSQFSSKVKKQFAICLPSSNQADGVAFFGSEPFFLLPPPGRNITSLLQFTPLLTKNPASADPSSDYYIGIEDISINLNAVTLPKNALKKFGVKISTVVPYTKLKSQIYKSFVNKFAFETRGIPRVNKVEPFDYCLNTTNLGSTRVGLPVPQIDLELSNGKNWTIFGANSMKQVKDDVACLAFVDGGDKAEQDVVIGSFQIEHNFLLFDFVNSRLGFSSTLFFFQTTCSNFNFTSGV